jgi:hypothetical protein
MGKDLSDNFPQTERVVSYIDLLSEMKVQRICFFGEEKLNNLYTQQLVILIMFLVTYEVFKQRGININFSVV